MDKDKEGIKMIIQMVGAIKAFGMVNDFVNAGRYGLLNQIKEGKLYKLLGTDWHGFCDEYLGNDHKTVDRDVQLWEQFGEPFLVKAEKIHLKKKDLLLLDRNLPEDAKAEIRNGVIKIADREFKIAEIEENVEEFRGAINSINRQVEDIKKDVRAKEKLIEQHHKHNERLETEIQKLEKKVSALEPPSTDEGRKEKFLEQMDIVFKHLSDATTLMNHTMDFSVALNDRDCAVKYRGAVKVINDMGRNLENKIGEVD